MNGNDTIFALSTAAGKAGIAVVRVSGRSAADCVNRIFGRLPPPRSASYGALREPVGGEIFDRGIVLWFPGPASATGEDMAEFHVHGSRAVLRCLLESLTSVEGCRPAEAGEFARRSFAAGKMGLVEIEGLADLLAAETAAQRRMALRQAGGIASEVFDQWRRRLIVVSAEVEALVDFADEDGVAEAAGGRWKSLAAGLTEDMAAEVRRSRLSARVREGAKVVLAGPPNAGKSSLLNALARRDVAIVSAIPGTTRDVLEVPLDIGGLLVTLTDTAGLRTTSDEIEVAGVDRAKREAESADLFIWVSSKDLAGSATESTDRRADLLVENKCDLPGVSISGLNRNDSSRVWLEVSARSGQGLDALLAKIGDQLRAGLGEGENGILSRARQVQAVQESIRLLNDAVQRSGDSVELIAEDLRRAGDALGRLTGRIGVEDLLAYIFSEFCIGK